MIDDCGSDSTNVVINDFINNFPQVNFRYVRNNVRRGSPYCRMIGYEYAINDLILFGEDDVYLEENYCSVLFNKIFSTCASIVSGRIIYLQKNESIHNSLKRFKFGSSNRNYFNKYSFSINLDSYFLNDQYVPFTHAIFLTKKKYLNKYKYDTFYSKGNCFREETDFQFNIFLNNHDILVTNNTHCFHMHKHDVSVGGQRINRFLIIFWNIYYTNYFFKKYYRNAKEKLSLPYNRYVGILIFSLIQLNVYLLQPIKTRFLRIIYL